MTKRNPVRLLVVAACALLAWLLTSGTLDLIVHAQEKSAAAGKKAPAATLDRAVLPIPEPQNPPITGQDARKAVAGRVPAASAG